MNVNQRHMLTMDSEICAFNNIVIMQPVCQDGVPGFVYNIHQPLMKAPETKHWLIQETNLDLSYNNYPCNWAARDDNSRVKTDSATTNTSRHSKTCYVAVPNQKKILQLEPRANRSQNCHIHGNYILWDLRDQSHTRKSFTPRNAATDSKNEKPTMPLTIFLQMNLWKIFLMHILHHTMFLGVSVYWRVVVCSGV